MNVVLDRGMIWPSTAEERMGLISVNITVTVDAEDLVNEVGEERAKRLIQEALMRDAIENMSDDLSQVLVEVEVGDGMIPVAVREVKIEGLEE